MNYIATVISNRSNGYIHLYWTGPPAFASNGRCIGRCSIESKNDGGNIISSLHSVSTIFVWSLSMWSTFNLLEHISLKKWLIFVSASHIPFGNKSQKANEMSVCINDTTKRLMSSPKCRSVEVINNPARPGSNHREVNCINYKQQ